MSPRLTAGGTHVYLLIFRTTSSTCCEPSCFEEQRDLTGPFTSRRPSQLVKNCVGEPQTWRESNVGDDVLAVVEGHQVLQGVCIHDEKAAVIQPHR